MHLPTYLFACTAVSLSTAKYIGGKKPPADCDRPVQFLKGKEFVDKINEHRSRMIKGKQNNGGHGKLPTGENVLEMRYRGCSYNGIPS
ncbi:hypothetical protein ANCCAN_00717 [Ancylostoma caninum]|uniref:SCP domain-containing protein n=1 Tax=Ancylostoma caninum TaxID=29170 RepID=A0A368H980_ANCCA|nr:hypothetical protein ANCCAN_00717 [Ancylostoma caninum]